MAKHSSSLLQIFIIISVWLLKSTLSQRGIAYPIKFQPELDSLDIGLYFRNTRLVKLQVMCLFYNGPCDIAGRWLKPRLIPGLFGNCPACSPLQKKMLPQWLLIFADRYPEMFRAVVAQWLMDQGYDVPISEIPRIQKAMGFHDSGRIINPKNVINASYEDALNTRELKRQPSIFAFIGRTRGGHY